MPIHDWTRVPSGLFHHFHQDWSIEIARTLNRGHLPRGCSALVEQRAGPREGEVLSIEGGRRPKTGGESAGSVATLEPPVTRIVRRTSKEIYSDRANRILVRHHLGRIVSVIEILSPGNKDSRAALRDFVEKTIDFLKAGIHVLVIDLFPPTSRDPCGIHKVIWDEILEEDFDFPPRQGSHPRFLQCRPGADRLHRTGRRGRPTAGHAPVPDVLHACQGAAGSYLSSHLGCQPRGDAPRRRDRSDAGTGAGRVEAVLISTEWPKPRTPSLTPPPVPAR